MPFINGLYYINPVMGEALEAAREAEAPLRALENGPHQDFGSDGQEAADVAKKAKQDRPVHRVEIEAAEMVPANSGRAMRGFVARIHRQPGNSAGEGHGNVKSQGAGAGHAETHVFSNHRDLLDFLRDELGNDSHSRVESRS